jgi:hypothetical protein
MYEGLLKITYVNYPRQGLPLGMTDKKIGEVGANG